MSFFKILLRVGHPLKYLVSSHFGSQNYAKKRNVILQQYILGTDTILSRILTRAMRLHQAKPADLHGLILSCTVRPRGAARA